MTSEESIQQQSIQDYVGPKVENSLGLLNRTLWVIPLSLVAISLLGELALIIGVATGIGSFKVLFTITKVAPIAVLFYYFLRLLTCLRQNMVNPDLEGRTDLLVPVPYMDRHLEISARTSNAISQAYVSGILGIIWIQVNLSWPHVVGETEATRLKYIYNHVDWINQPLPIIFELLFPSPITETGWEVLSVLGVLLFLFLITRSVVIIIEQLVSRFKEDSKERILGIILVHYYVFIELSRQTRLLAKILIAFAVNFYLYRIIIMFAAFEICLSINEGLASLKCVAI